MSRRTGRILGSDHPRTLTARNLAAAYMDAGDPSRAIPMLEKNLADQQRLLGSDHPNTLDCRNDLARAYQQVRDLDPMPLTVKLIMLRAGLCAG